MARIILHIFMMFTTMFAYTNITTKAIHQEITTKYFINDIEVTEKRFNKKLESLEETGGWFCLDTNTGGVTGYKCKDKSEQEYTYECTLDLVKSECRLTKTSINISKF
ncbi:MULTISPECIES: hypothetical protein [Aquimarina]|uniref:Uncharacterized protein n=1 Tax=Aquimarina algiphila TaxID=2047982 RepID=A0A554VRS0_9FLAO|nr:MULTISPECIES: hypothetical protein [Aquimarina]TSE11350.1 hypothetical protein FOF46_01590 [Aquimarina algiphila]